VEARPARPAWNAFTSDANLQRLLQRRAPKLLADDSERLARFGAWVASDVDAEAAYTDRFAPPRLETHDRLGALVNRVVHNPLYAQVHRDVYRHGIVGLAYGPQPRPFLISFTMGYLLAQADISIHCPVTLTGAVAYVLGRDAPKALRDAYLPDLTRMDGNAKTGATWVTELAGGSDVGAAETRAQAITGGVALTGFKWFTSNADCDLALATARPSGAPAGTAGLGLYLVPRALADGAPNRYRIRRLKEKFGTRGLATGEIELDGAWAVEVAPPPAGFTFMMHALGYSRVQNAVAAAGIQRRAFLEALAYAQGRVAFGAPIASFPMVQDVLLDMAARLEAGVALALEAAIAFDAAEADAAAEPWSRLATALAKYQTGEDAVIAASRAIEILGGVGYTDDYVTPRLLRDAQVLPVWEGPPNIQALEVLRLMDPRRGGFEALERRLAGLPAAADDRRLAPLADAVRSGLATARRVVGAVRDDPKRGLVDARRLTELLADVLAASLLIEEAAADLKAGDARKLLVARGFVAAKLTAPWRFRTDAGDGWPRRLAPTILDYQPIDPKDAGA
jgi:alkylation response protein AidB-like acyl-CoA dehydrogenase